MSRLRIDVLGLPGEMLGLGLGLGLGLRLTAFEYEQGDGTGGSSCEQAVWPSLQLGQLLLTGRSISSCEQAQAYASPESPVCESWARGWD